MCFVARNADCFILERYGNCDVPSALWAAGNYRLLLPAGCSDGPQCSKAAVSSRCIIKRQHQVILWSVVLL